MLYDRKSCLSSINKQSSNGKQKQFLGICYRYTTEQNKDKLNLITKTAYDYWNTRKLHRRKLVGHQKASTGNGKTKAYAIQVAVAKCKRESAYARLKIERTEKLLNRNYINRIQEGFVYKVFFENGDFTFKKQGRCV